MVVDADEPFFAPDPVRVDVDFGSPEQQGRGSVAFRALLVVPQVIAVVVLAFVSFVVVVIGWFAALALGRLPRWIAAYQMGWIAYATRVNAYVFLLVDAYPPFSFSAPDYPVAVTIGASRLSRLKVFFRLLLAIPASIASSLASQGLLVFSPILWLVTLVRGRMPQSLFSAAAAAIRYQARFSAYSGLVTDVYPSRLFGDSESLFAGEEDGRDLRLSLSADAKRYVALFLVLGLAATIGWNVLQWRSRPSAALIVAELNFESASQTFATSERNCLAVGTAFRCLEPKERVWSTAFDKLASDLSSIRFSGSQQAEADALAGDARAMAQALLAASRAKTEVAHATAFVQWQSLLHQFEVDSAPLFGHPL